MFLDCPSVSGSVRRCMRLSVRRCVLSALYYINQWTEVHQTLADDVVEGTDKLQFRF